LRKKEKNVEMFFWIFVLLLLGAQSGNGGVVLDRIQLLAWYPIYGINSFKFNLSSRQITSILAGTFTGCSQLRDLSLGGNQLTSLDASLFTGLSQLQTLGLNSNQLTSLDPSIFTGIESIIPIGLVLQSACFT
jgi:hypothetical protein